MTEIVDKKPEIRPFLRWAGSKRLLLKHLIPEIPKEYGTYFEPFLGSASLYLHLQPRSAILNDKAFEVVNLFHSLRDDVEKVLNYIACLSNDKETFYRIRSNRSSDPVERAAEFVFLNKTCWNGLFRVNASGGFNVPYGNNKVVELVDSENLRRCAKLLSDTKPDIKNVDFEQALLKCTCGDLVYLDPPYVTGHNNNGFLEYNEKIFAWEDQIRLAVLADKLADKGAHVIVSNANHNDVVALYPKFKKVVVHRNSTISGNPDSRGPISEIILTSRGPKNGARKR